jgi:hypothetical protein
LIFVVFVNIVQYSLRKNLLDTRQIIAVSIDETKNPPRGHM